MNRSEHDFSDMPTFLCDYILSLKEKEREEFWLYVDKKYKGRATHVPTSPSSIVNVASMTANIYGCEPCPKCQSKYRIVTNDRRDTIQCDDCGFEESITKKIIR